VAFRASGCSAGAAIPEAIKRAAYRVFQESLSNARKHVQAGQVEATLEVGPDGVRLEVHDDGVGFEGPARLGLVSMRERAEEAGGSLTIESEPGLGTQVLVEVPLKAP